MRLLNQKYWQPAIALATGIWAMTTNAAEIPLTHRAHLDAATQKWVRWPGPTIGTTRPGNTPTSPAFAACWSGLRGVGTPGTGRNKNYGQLPGCVDAMIMQLQSKLKADYTARDLTLPSYRRYALSPPSVADDLVTILKKFRLAR